MQDHRKLDVWHRSMDYAVRVYRSSAELPGDERFNLGGQLKRAAASVPLNLAEGAGCGTNVEFARFVGYAYRSLKEVATALELSHRLYPVIAPAAIATLIDEGEELARMIYTLRQRLLKTEN